MSQIPLNYERVERQLASADLEISGAEVHGIQCGLLCSGKDDVHERWMAELMEGLDQEDLLVRECRDTLIDMQRETAAMINGPGLGCAPFLPDDEQAIKIRARGVRDWCQGFLYGVGLAGVMPGRDLSDHTQEALADLSEVTRMDVELLKGGDEEEEHDLMEVAEFIWVAAMLVHAELAQDPAGRS